MTSLMLTVTNGPNEGRSQICGCNKTCMIGRGPQSDWVVIDLRMSREHFLIVGSDGRWWARDLRSCHGTLVNDELIEEKLLEQDDVITAGDTKFLVSLTDAPVSSSSPPVAQPPHFDRRDSTRQTWTRSDK